MKTLDCEVCGLKFTKGVNNVGIRTKILCYEDKQGRLTKQWRIASRKKRIFVCRKCVDTLNGLVRSYRRG